MTKSGSESGVDQPCFNGIYGSTGGDLYHRCQSPIPPVKLPRSGRAAGRARGRRLADTASRELRASAVGGDFLNG